MEKTALLAALAILAITPSVSKASSVQMFSDSFSGSATNVTLSVPRFDEAIGELTAVTARVSGIARAIDTATSARTFCFTPGPGAPQVCQPNLANAFAQVQLNVTFPFIGTTILELSSDDDQCTSPLRNRATCTATAEAVVSFTNVSQSLLFDPMFIGEFTGPGTLSFAFQSNAAQAIEFASVVVAYSYTPAAIPVPPAGAFLLGGLAILAGTRNKWVAN
ncbi:MAG: hypothetical protein AAGF71_12265 [Pseudomonadota bacterium]